MLFGPSRTAQRCHATFDESAESDRMDSRHIARGGLRPNEVPGSGSAGSVLSGWKAWTSNLDQTDALRSNDLAESMNLLEALQQNRLLRKKLDETRQEIEVLVEALEYARSIASCQKLRSALPE
jgi:hypothetical protein